MRSSIHATVSSLLMFCAGLLAPIVASGAEQQPCGSRVATVLGFEQSLGEDQAKSGALPPLHPQYHIQIAADAEYKPVRWPQLQFWVSEVPSNATVGCWKLRMYRESSQEWGISSTTNKVEVFDTTAPQQVQIFPSRAAGQSFNWSEKVIDARQAISAGEVGTRAPRAEFPRRVHEEWEKTAWTRATAADWVPLYVEARSTSRSQVYTYFRSNLLESSCKAGSQNLPCCKSDGEEVPCFNLQPRLVVDYTPVLSVPTFDWPQAGFDAQHSGRSQWAVWEYGALPMTFGQLTTMPLYIQSDPVFYQGQLILPVETKDADKFFIIAIGSTGQELWRRPIDSRVEQPLVLDRKGRLHVFTAKELVILDLQDISKAPQSIGWFLMIEKIPSDMRLTAPATIGYNGALYLPTNKGVYALTPGRKVFWKYPMENSCPGKVALSADEAIAYFVDGTTGRLIAVDNTDGSRMGENKRTWISPGLTQDTAQPCTREQRFPVVGKDAIYVTDGFPAGSVLHRFETVGGTRSEVAGGKGVEAVSIPVVGQDGRLFFVMSVPTSAVVGQDGRPVFVKSDAGPSGGLCAYDPIERGAGNPLECRPATTQQEMFSPHTRLVLDASGTLYAVDPVAVKDAQTVAALSTAGCEFLKCAIRFQHSQKVTKYRAEGTSNNFEGQPILSPEGVLYARSRNYVFHVSRTLQGGSVTHRTFDRAIERASATVFVSPSHVHLLALQIPETSGMIVSSGQSISLASGFQVARGARVVFRVGSPTD